MPHLILAKSKTEIGATSQREVNLDRALWEMMSFPFPVVLEMQPSHYEESFKVWIKYANRFMWKKIVATKHKFSYEF